MRKLIILLLITIGCDTDRKLTGEYIGFYSENEWRITLKTNQEFDYYANGHWFGLETKGKYFVKGDTLILNFPDNILNRYRDGVDYKYLIEKDSCLIGIESQYDFCKVRPYKWSSNTRDINYPQTKPHNREDIAIVANMLQEAFNLLDKKYIADTTKNLVARGYYQINRKNNIKLAKFGKEVILLSEEEIKSSKDILQYISLGIKYGKETAHVTLEVLPNAEGPFYSVYTVYLVYIKEKGKWKRTVDSY